MKALTASAAALLLLPATAFAASIEDFAKAMGADKVSTIEFSGSGSFYALGQSANPSMPWPRFMLESYRLTVNYGAAALTEELVLTQGENPPRGGGRQPVHGSQMRERGVSGGTGWVGSGRNARPAGAAGGIHTLWTTPHGVIKAAEAAKAKPDTRMAGGKTYQTVTFGEKGVFTATAWFDSRNMLRGVNSRLTNPVFGDMDVRTVYSDYKNFAGVMFPTRIKVISGGFPTLDLTVNKVTPNAAAEIAAPEGLPPMRQNVKIDKVADGVWFLTGGSHHSVAVEMKDHVVVFEGPIGDARANAVIEATRKTIPGKPIRFVVNTHHHFDHSGGLRAFAAEGATIVTHKINVPFFQAAYGGTHRISPDSLARAARKARFVGTEDKHVMTDGSRTIELYRLAGNAHNDGLLIGYLPKEKIMTVADAFSPRTLLKAPDRRVNLSTANLWRNLDRLKLDIETILPIHGRKVGFEQMRFAAGQP